MSRTKQLAARSPGHRQQAGEEKDTNSRHSSSEKTEAGSVSGVVRVSEVKSDGKSCMRASVRLPFLAPVAPLCETPGILSIRYPAHNRPDYGCKTKNVFSPVVLLSPHASPAESGTTRKIINTGAPRCTKCNPDEIVVSSRC